MYLFPEHHPLMNSLELHPWTGIGYSKKRLCWLDWWTGLGQERRGEALPVVVKPNPWKWNITRERGGGGAGWGERTGRCASRLAPLSPSLCVIMLMRTPFLRWCSTIDERVSTTAAAMPLSSLDGGSTRARRRILELYVRN